MTSNPHGHNPNGPTLHGIDVAAPQGLLFDWGLVRADGIRFAYVQATNGVPRLRRSGVDPTFARNWRQSRENGLLRGPYHFLAAEESGVVQAEHHVTTVGELADDDLDPMVDVEALHRQTPARVLDCTCEFVERLRALTGRAPLFYTYPSFWTNPPTSEVPGLGNPDAPPELSALELMIAHYLVGTIDGRVYPDAPPTIPRPWDGRWAIRQTSGNLGPRVPGIPRDVDRDVFWGTEEEFRARFTPRGRAAARVTPTLEAHTPISIPSVHEVIGWASEDAEAITAPQTPTSKSSQRMAAVRPESEANNGEHGSHGSHGEGG